jgi:leucyl aminopeptidase (aminopeptidase T)
VTEGTWCVNLLTAASFSPGDRVVIIVDEPLASVGKVLRDAVRSAGGSVALCMWSGDRPLNSSPPGVRDLASQADICLFLANEPLADEAKARFEVHDAVTKTGGREIFVGFVDQELLDGALSGSVPNLAEQARSVLSQLSGAREIRVRAPAGTDLLLHVAGRSWLTDATPLLPGTLGNYPGGEVYIAPHSNGAAGKLVVDLTIPYACEGMVDEPVLMVFERGRVTKIDGGKAARKLSQIVSAAGAGADIIGEFGIGMNPALSPIGHMIIDEKAANTFHIAIGRNTGPYGGDNESSIHVDCIFAAGEIEIDGKAIVI